MASSLCFVYNNAIDSASLSADSTFGGTNVNNLKNDIKGMVHSSTASSVIYTATWSSPATIQAIAFPAITASIGTTVSVSINSVEVVTAVLPFQYTRINSGYIGSASGRDFAFGRYSTGLIILPEKYTNVTSCVITITLPSSGTITCSRIIAGELWQPNRFASNGIKHEIKNDSSVVRSGSGNLFIDKGFQYNTLSFDIEYMESTDRENLYSLLRKIGGNSFVFVSLFSDTTNSLAEDYSIYGVITNSPITYEIYNIYSYSVSIEGW